MNIKPTFLLILILISSLVNATQYYVSTTGLDTNNGTQTDLKSTSSENLLAFDPIGTIMAIPAWTGKALLFITMSVFAPLIIGSMLAPYLISQPILGLLLGIILTIWQLTTVYNIYKFFSNKRGIAWNTWT